MNPAKMQARHGITAERIIHELRGIQCIALEDSPQPKQTITVSRSFGGIVTELDDLRAAVAT